MTQADDPRFLAWRQFIQRALPFSDVASVDFPLPRILRLALFQVSVAIALVLLVGTLNRVMVVELGVPTWLVATMVAMPLVFAPFRALIGHRSDYHHSAFGLRRVPYIWLGTMLQFGGFAIMPFAILLLADSSNSLSALGKAGAALAFLLVGAGLHTTQTAGLALATDLAPPDKRPRVVALLYVMLLFGMLCSGLLFGQVLKHFTPQLLIQVIQGSAVATLVLNLVALWKQEAINRERAETPEQAPPFLETWRSFTQGGSAARLLVVVGLGTAGFTMQDILLEPYGGQILHMSVGQTTALTALLAAGNLVAYVLAGYLLGRGANPNRISAAGAFVGLFAFAAILYAASVSSVPMFRAGTWLIGFGGGLLAVCTLIAAMELADGASHVGLALGAWGAVHATANGLAVAFGGAACDGISALVRAGVFSPAWSRPALGYEAVYAFEILLLVGTLVVVAPLAWKKGRSADGGSARLGLDQLPT